MSRTHRVAFDWLFDRINLEPKIQIKYVDMPNKESFSRDEWNHLLRLFNIMNFSMFSCSHLSEFLSDRSQSRAPCQKEVNRRLQEKAHQWQNRSLRYRRKRDKSTWYHAARGARKTLHRIWGIWSNPGNFDEEKEVEIVTGKPVQTASKSEVGYSQVSRQENAPTAEGNLCM